MRDFHSTHIYSITLIFIYKEFCIYTQYMDRRENGVRVLDYHPNGPVLEIRLKLISDHIPH